MTSEVITGFPWTRMTIILIDVNILFYLSISVELFRLYVLLANQK